MEHATATSITVMPSRESSNVQIEVRDDGRGMPDPVEEGLGLQIVRSLVEQDMRGELRFDAPDTGGCSARISVPQEG